MTNYLDNHSLNDDLDDFDLDIDEPAPLKKVPAPNPKGLAADAAWEDAMKKMATLVVSKGRVSHAECLAAGISDPAAVVEGLKEKGIRIDACIRQTNPIQAGGPNRYESVYGR
jgi:hypothetical protein